MINKTHLPNALPNLETTLADINTIITQMEQGGLTLEESLTAFEKGIQLIKHAQKILQSAEQKVQILTKNNMPSSDSSSE